MIPIKPQPEPDDFDEKVRKPGLAFLSKVPNPKTKDWKNRDYWRRSLRDLYDACNHICAYSAQWISRPEGSPTVDHFLPKSAKPELAYEWHNFRLACLTLNNKKRTELDVIDPFELPVNSFILDFPSLIIKPNPELLYPLKGRVISTINRLELNDYDKCIDGRLEWLKTYYEDNSTFDSLKRKAPFIAYELERQGLAEVDKIAYIMGVR
ncbi:MAG: HNH endonuclease [Dolichospermum sp.]